MKYSFFIAIISMVLLGLTACINTSSKTNNKVLPTVGNIANEYLVQNTVKFAKANGIFQTDIDKNPAKYTILNGQSAAESKSNVQTIYSKDTAPYYDATKPQPQQPRKNPDQSVALNRYTNQLYPLDKVPYYSPSKPYRAILNGGGDHFKTPAKLGDLDKTLPTQSNINELKKQLDKLNDYIEGPKYMTHDAQGREVYFKDPKAYYDPTLDDKRARKVQLQSQIRHLTNEINSNKPTLIVGTKKSSVKIQNFVNTNSEETSEFIGKSYYYDVDRSTLSNSHRTVMQNRSNLRTESNGSKKEQPKKNEAINIYTRKPERIKIGSTNKYYDEKSTVVEAENTGSKVDKRFYYEDKKQVVNNKQTINNNQNTIKAPNTQGLKTAGFRILSLKK